MACTAATCPCGSDLVIVIAWPTRTREVPFSAAIESPWIGQRRADIVPLDLAVHHDHRRSPPRNVSGSLLSVIGAAEHFELTPVRVPERENQPKATVSNRGVVDAQRVQLLMPLLKDLRTPDLEPDMVNPVRRGQDSSPWFLSCNWKLITVPESAWRRKTPRQPTPATSPNTWNPKTRVNHPAHWSLGRAEKRRAKSCPSPVLSPSPIPVSWPGVHDYSQARRCAGRAQWLWRLRDEGVRHYPCRLPGRHAGDCGVRDRRLTPTTGCTPSGHPRTEPARAFEASASSADVRVRDTCCRHRRERDG
jgi:hypothetical protein